MTTVASDLERYMLELINAARAANGLAPLVLELNLNTSAQVHSDWMVATDTFSHTGAGGSTATQRMLAAGMDLSGSWGTAENLATVGVSGASDLYDEVRQLHKNLMNSPGHYANLMNPDLTVIGIGITVGQLTYPQGKFNSVLVTQNFAYTGGRVDLDLAGGAAADVLTGLSGDDVITAGGGNDTVVTGAGADTVDAGAGDDLIRTGTGVKRIEGGTGTDTLELGVALSAAQATATAGGLRLTAPGIDFDISGVEMLRFTDASISVEDFLAGGAWGNDLLKGDGTGPDTLEGMTGDDVLLGDGRGMYGTEVSAQVYRLYAAVFGREPDVNGHQTWTGLLASEARTVQQAVAGFTASPEFQARYGGLDAPGFVTQLYGNVLGRAPNSTDLNYWVGRIEGGLSREAVVLHFAESPEHKLRTATAQADFDLARDPTDWTDDVYRLYLAVLGREPDAAGLTGWATSLANGTEPATVVTRFMASSEFQARYGTTTDAEFVTLLYDNVLGRAPDAGGFATWTGLLASGTPRETVVLRFAQSSEFVTNTAADLEAWVQGQGMDDVLRPGPGADMLSGGLWADTFVFAPGEGSATVTDLEPWDVVDLSGFGYADAAEAMAHVTTQDGDAVFDDGGLRVVFLDAQLSQDMLAV